MKLCLDIGGHKISSAIISNNTRKNLQSKFFVSQKSKISVKIIKKYIILTEIKKGKKTVLKNICNAINKFYNKYKKKITSINIATAGPFKDIKKGIVNCYNLPLKNFNLKSFIYKKYKKTIKIDNDANCFTLGEAVFGAGKKYNIVLGLTLGTGIGGGLVINKKIFHGRGNAAEFGHILIGRYDFEYYFKRLKSRGYIRNYNMLGYYLGIGITSLIHSLDPEIIVIGGGVAENFNKFKTEMNKTIKKKCIFKPCKIVKARLKDSALLGASLL